MSPSRSAGAAISPELAPAADAAPATTGPSSPGRDSAGPGGSGDRGGHGRPWLVILVATGIVLAIAVTIARGVYRDGPLEPDAPTPQGSKAVVEVLTDLGTQVRVDRHTEDAAQSLREDRTVLVTAPSSLSAPQLDELAGALEEGEGQLVLVQPDFVTLSYLTPLITPAGSLRAESTVEAGQSCGDLTFEARALAVPGEEGLRGPSTLYSTRGEAQGCFDTPEGDLVAADGQVLVLGSADLLTNEGVREADNSALVLNVLGPSGELSWYVPSATDPMATTGPELLTHLPDWAGPVGLWILLVAGIALIAWGRRFGPVVVEPLPVTVRPQEMVLGRARLLQQSSSRDAAATALRSATSVRLALQLGLRRESTLDALVAALAPHVQHSPEQIRSLLGPTPVTRDQDLVQLARDLDRLEKEIDR